jgi:hypothetical protein
MSPMMLPDGSYFRDGFDSVDTGNKEGLFLTESPACPEMF